MSERQTFLLSNREKRASVAQMIANLELGSEIKILSKEDQRTAEQNRAVHGLIGQILKQRPHHGGLAMSMETYKAIFLHALGKETRFLPTLDGDGMFPLGLSTSKLKVRECADLITFILAWCAREKLTIKHFDDGQGGAGANNPRSEAA